jgi:hypothetical protein
MVEEIEGATHEERRRTYLVNGDQEMKRKLLECQVVAKNLW